MSASMEQIKMLALQGYDAEQISIALEYEIEDVLIILEALKLSRKTAENALENATVVNGASNRNGNDSNHNDSNSPGQTQNPQANAISKLPTADDIYQRNRAKVAQRLVTIALYEENNISAAVKAGIYVNEEATNRNEARAKKASLGALMDLGQTLLHLKQAKDAVAASISNGSVSNLIPIDV